MFILVTPTSHMLLQGHPYHLRVTLHFRLKRITSGLHLAYQVHNFLLRFILTTPGSHFPLLPDLYMPMYVDTSYVVYTCHIRFTFTTSGSHLQPESHLSFRFHTSCLYFPLQDYLATPGSPFSPCKDF